MSLPMLTGRLARGAAHCTLALGFLFGISFTAYSQNIAVAEVDGHVIDPSGQSIAGAQVKMIETARDAVHSTVTDATGRYSLPNLPIGPYRLEVTAQGFKSFIQTGIELEVAHNIEIPVTMSIGAVTESIQIVANAAMVETKDNSIAQVIDAQRIDDLPLNGRNTADLVAIIGATASNNMQNGMTLNGGDLTGSKNMQGSNGSNQYSVAGGAANGLNFLLDGGDNNDAFSNVPLPVPFPDAVQEFSVQTNGLSAQYGLHPSGVVNIVTKSGSNAFHGDLFEFLRNGDLNARTEGTLARDTLKRSQFGGTMGGRIIKDKLFFFGGYQGTRQRSDPASNTAYVPTAAALKGDFSVLDGAKANGGCLTSFRQLKDPTGTPYPNNLIPVNTFDTAGAKLANSYIPVSTDPCGKILFGYLTNNPDDQWIGRVDYNISPKQFFFGRYYIYDYTALSLFDGKNALTTGTAGNHERSQTMTIGHTYTISPTLVNSFHATFDRRRDDRGDAANLFSPADLGVNMYIAIPNYTQLTVSGYSGGGFNVGCGTCAPGNFDINTYQVADDFTWIKGRHQFAFGVDGRKDQFNSFNNQQANGQFTFNGTTTGDGLADLLVGRFSNLTDGNVISDYLRQNVLALYAQDAFHVTQHLALNFGIRWEPSVPAYDKYGRGNQFSWPLFLQGWHSSVYPGAPAGLIFYGDKEDKYGKSLTASHWALFSPRFGFVWDPKGDAQQTLRGAFTMMHDSPELFYPERWTTNPPYVSSLTLTSGQFSNPFATYVLNGKTGDPFPGAAVFPTQGTYISIPGNVTPTYMMSWNLSYQRQVSKSWLATANYLGNVGRHIWGSTDVNYAIPTAGATTSNTNARRLTSLVNPALGQYYANIQQTDDGAISNYNGLLVSLRGSIGRSLTLLSNYTWSHCSSTWDFAGELAGVLYQNPLNRAQGEKGNCGYDHRHIFNTSIVVTSPGIGQHFVHAVTVGWQLSPIVSLYTGSPIQVTDGGKDISLSGQGQDRPNVIDPANVYFANKSPLGYLNPAAFQCAGSNAACTVSSGQFGDLGRNSLYGPGAITWNMAISRYFQMNERWKLEFRSDFFNIMNHGNWNNPVTNVTSGTFGQVIAFGSPRIIQMALKLYF
ncbi:MAG TPA: carboxypeptidase regulatory-like domain-containing protein [Candidatus Limnocylindrales bacterium]|nr:carboxypeptidase regulatory-like domain-containing protein [Candidatus Limnocylindrales bacterium]